MSKGENPKGRINMYIVTWLEQRTAPYGALADKEQGGEIADSRKYICR